MTNSVSNSKIQQVPRIYGLRNFKMRDIPKNRAEGFPGLDLNSGWN